MIIMKNKEIEELLNKLRNTADTSFFAVCGSKEELNKMPKSVCKFLSLNDKQAKLLLLYIEQLENLCNKYEQEHKTTFEIWKKDIKKLKQLQNNRDKSIEYVEEKGRLKYNPNELINILKGDSDE